MRLAISNIAWDVSEDEQVARLLKKYDIDAIDVAPSKYFSISDQTKGDDINKVKEYWAAQGIEITGMQSLLFGTSGLNLFGSSEVQKTMLAHLNAVCRIGAGLGATRLVFGSPRNRDRSGLTDDQTINTAIEFFQHLGDIAATHNVFICLEPNPPCYDSNFMTTSLETARVVKKICHPAIKMQLDIGALTINSEDISSVLVECAPLIGHVHASEPNLVPLGDMATDHQKIHSVLQKYIPNHIVSIEMRTTKDEPHLVSIERALKVATENYRQSIGSN